MSGATGASSGGGGVRHEVVIIGLTVLVAIAGSMFTQLGPWYQALEKPEWQPPDWAFPVAWTIIFALTAWSAIVMWRLSDTAAARASVAVLYLFNGALNVLWSYLFFTLQRPDLSYLEAFALLGSIVAIVIYTTPRSFLATLLIAPYFAWVSVALALNGQILALNPGLAGGGGL